MSTLAGQLFLVTGAASGIGRATARYLASKGAYLSLADRNVDGLKSVVDELTRTAIKSSQSNPTPVAEPVSAALEKKEKETPNDKEAPLLSGHSPTDGPLDTNGPLASNSDPTNGHSGSISNDLSPANGHSTTGHFLPLNGSITTTTTSSTATLPIPTDASIAAISARFLTSPLDVRSPASVRSWIDSTTAHFAGIPVAGAANLAGVVGPSIAQEKGEIRNMTDDEFSWVMDINCTGTFNCLRAELQVLKQGANGRGGGAIVNASSIAGIAGVVRNGPYVASKHAVLGMTRTVAKEEGERGIRCNCVAPGIIATPMITEIETAAGTTELFGKKDPGAMARKGDPEEVAKVIAFLLSDDSSFVNGVVVPVDGGWFC